MNLRKFTEAQALEKTLRTYRVCSGQGSSRDWGISLLDESTDPLWRAVGKRGRERRFASYEMAVRAAARLEKETRMPPERAWLEQELRQVEWIEHTPGLWTREDGLAVRLCARDSWVLEEDGRVVASGWGWEHLQMALLASE